MLNHATRHCLERLTDFEGRTSRAVYQSFANTVLVPVVVFITFLGLGLDTLIAALLEERAKKASQPPEPAPRTFGRWV